VIGTFAVKRTTNGVDIDERKEEEFMNSTLAALQAVFTAIDEVAVQLKAKAAEAAELAAALALTPAPTPAPAPAPAPIASPIEGNFIFTDLMAGHFNKDFVTNIDTFSNDDEIQDHFHEYLNICYEMLPIYKNGIRAVLEQHDYKVHGKHI
jgi:hypothetical protein